MKHSNHKSLPKTGRGGIDYWLHVYIQYIYILIFIYTYICLLLIVEPFSLAKKRHDNTPVETKHPMSQEEAQTMSYTKAQEWSCQYCLASNKSCWQTLLAQLVRGSQFVARSPPECGTSFQTGCRGWGFELKPKVNSSKTNVTANLNFCRHRTLASWMGLLIWHQPVTSPRTLPLQTTSQTIL